MRFCWFRFYLEVLPSRPPEEQFVTAQDVQRSYRRAFFSVRQAIHITKSVTASLLVRYQQKGFCYICFKPLLFDALFTLGILSYFCLTSVTKEHKISLEV